jgi:hypothetical protein
MLLLGVVSPATSEGPPPLPEELTEVATASATKADAAIFTDPTSNIVAWGRNASGLATPPAGNDYTAIAAGGYHGLALKADGSIVGWGYNYDGQATPPAGNDYTAIAAGEVHGLALIGDPVTLVERMVDSVADLNLANGISNSLDAKLANVVKTLDDTNENNNVSAINRLEAFINELEAQAGNKIPQADADNLIADARLIINLLTM